MKLLHHQNQENASIKFDEFEELLKNMKNNKKVFLKELQAKLIELDAVLFNRRITKFVKLSDKLDTRSLGNVMKIENQLLDTMKKNLLIYVSRDNHITNQRHSRNKLFDNSDKQRSKMDTELVNNRLEETLYVIDGQLVNALFDIVEVNGTNNIGGDENNTNVKSNSAKILEDDKVASYLTMSLIYQLSHLLIMSSNYCPGDLDFY